MSGRRCGDLARQQRAALRRRERRVGLVDAERGQHLGDRRAVAAGVLADVEAGEVEAEDLDLADRVVQLRGGDELPLARLQRALGEPQVGQQLRGRLVAVRAVLARRAHARDQQREEAAVGLLRVAALQPRGLLGEAPGELLQRRLELGRAVDEPVRQRHPLGEQLEPLGEQVQAGRAHHLERLRGDRRGDVGVAVAVPAHPGPEREQRAAPGSPRPGRPPRPPPRARGRAPARRDAASRRSRRAPRGPRRAGWGRRRAPRRSPTAPGSSPPARAGRPSRRRARRALVEVAQAREDARELLDRRAPPRLGRVGGHDEPELGAGEHVAQLARRSRRARRGARRRRAGSRCARRRRARARGGAGGGRARCPRPGS